MNNNIKMIDGDLFQANADDKINLKSILSDYLPYWYLFALGVGVCVTLAFFRIRYTVPQYYVASTLLIKDQGTGSELLSGASAESMEMFRPKKSIDDEINILKSKSLMERVLRELSFNTTYYLEGRVHDMEVYGNDLPIKIVVSDLQPRAYGKRIFIYPKDNNSFQLGEEMPNEKLLMSTYQYGQQIEKPYGVFTVIEATDSVSLKKDDKVIVVFHDVKKLASHYSEKLYVAPVSQTSNVLNVGLTDQVWKNGVDILNKLIEVYEKEAVEDKNMMASNALAFIDERLQYLNAELTDVEKNVELYKRQNAVTDVSSEAELSLQNASDYNKQLAEFDIQVELLKSVEDYLQKPGDEVALVPSALNIQDPTLHILISKFNELQLERQRMQRTMQPDNPLMLNINEQLSNLRINIGENIKNIRNGLIITRQNLIASSKKFEYRKKRVPAMERELLEINRQQSVKEGLYLYLLQKREESALSLAATVSNFRVVDPPAVIYPIFPNKPMIYMIAILAGLIVPFSLLYVKNLLNDKVMELKDIQRGTRTPVLGEIARNETKQPVVVTQDGANPLVEMFRLIRTNLQFATLGKPNKVILVTSSMSGEGKSFFCINLAASLVLTGKRVVVLGMDLRRPTLLKSMKIADGIGITNYLIADNISVVDIIRSSNILPNLFVISSGPALPSPTELMMSPKVNQLFETLRASFDHIIIDSAPIGLVADGFTLAPYLDSTIYMVRRNYTPQDSLAIIEKVYRERTLKFPMIVLNDTIIKNKKYGYGYGYSGQKSKKSRDASIKRAMPVEDVVSVK